VIIDDPSGELEGELWSPLPEHDLRASVVRVSGWVRGRASAVRELSLQRPGELAVRLADPSRFDALVPTGRGGALELWALCEDGGRRLCFRRRVPARLAPLDARAAAGFAASAARKAWDALREGRLAASPARWLRDLRQHYLDATARRAVARSSEAALARVKEELAERERAALARFLDGGERLAFEPGAAPRVSAILILYNRAELSLAALRSLPADVEVVVVDNASRDRTAETLERIDGATILRNRENRGFLRAVNQAAEAARGEHLLLLNSDAVLEPGALDAGVAALESAPEVGAVGGKLIRLDGRLQEAGSVLFADGSSEGCGRGESPDAPWFAERRAVDYCSGALLLTRRRTFAELGGFDERFAPAYFEDADYCARLWSAGLRVLYEPGFAARHVEFASAESIDAALASQAERRALFLRKHAAWLRAPRPRAQVAAGRRVLLIDDRAPLPEHGAGHPRALALVRALVADGHRVTIYPTIFPHEDEHALARRLPPSVEVVVGRGAAQLGAFLDERLGEFELVFVSRPTNLRLVQARLRLAGLWPSPVPIVYDAEAIVALREAERRKLAGDGAPDETARELAEEIALADGARVFALGHALEPAPTPRPFEARAGLLFVGALHDLESPNVDSLRWFCRAIFPAVRAALGDVWLTVVGAGPSRRLLAELGEHVEVLGAVDDLRALYDQARVFVAPTRFAAGVPHKLHEAAARGLPFVCTPLLARQVGWRDGHELLAGADAAAFADAVVRLYRDRALWQRLREGALRRVAADCAPQTFAASLRRVIAACASA
jgi:GT2 family glycosyltransferase